MKHSKIRYYPKKLDTIAFLPHNLKNIQSTYNQAVFDRTKNLIGLSRSKILLLSIERSKDRTFPVLDKIYNIFNKKKALIRK